MLQATKELSTVSIEEGFKESLLDALSDIPTGDNCQPFRYRFDNSNIYIYHDSEAAKHELNCQNKSSLISYGCIKATIDIVSSHFDLSPEYNEPLRNNIYDELWAVVSFTATKRQGNELIKEITKRVTNRGLYNVPEASTVKKIREALPSEFSLIKINDNKASKIAQNDQIVWKDSKTLSDLLHQTNLLGNKPSGLNFENLYVSMLDRIPLLLVKAFPFLGSLIWPLVKMNSKKGVSSSSYILAYFSKTETIDDYILIGEKCYKEWLNITKYGLVMQPITSSTYVIKDGKSEVAKKNIPLNQILGLEKNVAWAFRIGVPKLKNIKSMRISKSELTIQDPSSPEHLERKD